MAKTIEELRVEATAEIEARKPMWGQSTEKGRYEYSDDEYDDAIERLAQTKLDDQTNGYKRARQQSYPSIPDQLDMQYWDAVNGTTTWQDAIAKVKSDNPKP